MKTLVISKPSYETILPLVEFPQDGDKFIINNSIETVSSIGTIVALTLANYKMDISFTGIVGNDTLGERIKNIFNEYSVDTKYIEVSVNESTNKNYKIYNSKSNKFTSIEERVLKSNLNKYKYDFVPQNIVMDDKDHPANLAALNNFPEANIIFIGEKFTKDTAIYCSKCKYIISNLDFVKVATGMDADFNKPKNIIALFQKYIDLYNSNLIILLSNFDVLYCINDEVRIIKNINKNLTNKAYIYYSVLSYFLLHNIDIENSIKMTNKAMLNSGNEIDMVKNIPDNKIIDDIIGNYASSNDLGNIVEGNNDIERL